jgi:hypothetical protein
MPRARFASRRRVRTVLGGAPPPLPFVYRRWRGWRNIEHAVFSPASPPLVMWKVYEHPEDCPAEYVARKFVITEDFYGASKESISSMSLRDVRNLLRSLYRGLIQLQLSPDDEPHIVEVWL